MLGVDRCSSIKHYLNATKVKQSALNARKTLRKLESLGYRVVLFV